MASSLEKLVENLYDPSDKFNNFTLMQQHYPQHIELLCQKGDYPYAWVNDIKKLDHKRIHKKEKIKIVSVLSQECAATRTLVQKVMTTNLR
jgi:hypothetical protein